MLVTGASRGIGLRLAERFVERGASVALVARNEALLQEVAARIGGSVHPTDLSDPAQVRGLVARVEADGGPVDVLVNNAGLDNIGPLEAATEEQVSELMRVNLLAPMELCRQVVPGMVARRSGHIVNISSWRAAPCIPPTRWTAVERGRRVVRLPKRAMLFRALRAAPQRMVRLLSAGIPNRSRASGLARLAAASAGRRRCPRPRPRSPS